LITCCSGCVDFYREAASYGKYFTAYNILQAAVSHIQWKNPKNFVLIEKIRYVFATLDLFSLFWGLGCVLNNRKFLLLNVTFKLEIALWIGAGIWAFTAFAIVKFINNKMLQEYNNSGPLPTNSNVKIEFNRPPWEKIIEFNHVTRITLCVVNLMFATHSPTFWLINAASIGYTLLKLAERKWVKATAIFTNQELFPNNIKGYVENIKAEYFFFLFPFTPKRKEHDEDCLVCPEALDQSVISCFCPNHTLHVKCISPWIAAKIRGVHSSPEGMLKGFQSNKLIVTRDQNTEITYPSKIPVSSLPNCPGCRKPPILQRVFLHMTEFSGATYPSGEVTLVN